MSAQDISVVMITVDTPERNAYREETLAGLRRSGMYESPRLFNFHPVFSGERTAHENAAEALSIGAQDETRWVLFLEDDIEVIDGFIDAVGEWLDRNASFKGHVYSFSVPHPAHLEAKGEMWDYPINTFCCTQAFALRSEDASNLSAYLLKHPTVVGPDGNASTGAYDLAMRRWAKLRWPDYGLFYASVPSFVQHTGAVSEITPNRALIRMPNWPGTDWRFTPEPKRKRRLLWIGDAACQTGFARATHETLEVLKETWDVYVLGVNYRGDPHEDAYPFNPIPTYPIWPAGVGGDLLGVARSEKIIKRVEPDCIIIQNDPWNFPHYYRAGLPERATLVGAVAIDGRNCRGENLQPFDKAIFWTQFALDEARQGGFSKPGAVVPLGVDTTFWTPGSKAEARQYLFKRDYDVLQDAFIVLNVNRNQPRKRMDLTIRYFAEWINQVGMKDAYLYLHIAPTGDNQGYDCEHLAKYYGIEKNLILADMGAWNGVSDATLRAIYRCADVGISTTQGEGWGLPALEGMACGLPQILPDWSAYGEWARPAAKLIQCTSTSGTWRSSVVGGVPDEDQFIQALDDLYNDRLELEVMYDRSIALANRPEYRWRAIGEKFRDELDALVGLPSETRELATV